MTTAEEQPLNFAGKWLVRNGCLTAIVHQQIDGQWRGVIAADIETSWDAYGNNAQFRDWDLVECLDGRASKR